MSMLADPRRKQKISADPRNLNWKNDKEKFGVKLMEKMGWSAGKGLGANEHGSVEPIKVSLKSDNRGVGCTRNYADNWIAHQDDFNSLLANLNSVGASGTAETGYGSDPEPVQVQKLAEKSQTAKGRVPYLKFAKGKDLSMKTNEDLDCIFGKRKSKSAPVTPQTKSEVNSEDEQSEEKSTKPEEESSIMTFTSGTSVQDYFAKKMAALKKSRSGNKENQNSVQRDERSSDVDEPRCGFGFGAPSMNAEVSKPSVNSQVVSGENEDSSGESTPKKKKKSKKSKRKAEEMEDNSVNEEEEEANPPKKSKKKKKNRDEEEIVEPEVEESHSSSSEELPKKKKKKKKSKEKDLESDTVSPLEAESPKKEKKSKRKRREKEDEQEDITVGETEERVSKKEKKSKKNKSISSEDQVETSEVADEKPTKNDKEKNMVQSKTTRVKAVDFLDSLEKETGIVAVNQAHSVDMSKDVVLTWHNKKKTDTSDFGFSGSNFSEIKGYGNGYADSLTLMPMAKTRKIRK